MRRFPLCPWFASIGNVHEWSTLTFILHICRMPSTIQVVIMSTRYEYVCVHIPSGILYNIGLSNSRYLSALNSYPQTGLYR